LNLFFQLNANFTPNQPDLILSLVSNLISQVDIKQRWQGSFSIGRCVSSYWQFMITLSTYDHFLQVCAFVSAIYDNYVHNDKLWSLCLQSEWHYSFDYWGSPAWCVCAFHIGNLWSSSIYDHNVYRCVNSYRKLMITMFISAIYVHFLQGGSAWKRNEGFF
jgi:hypothetical protein